MKNKKPRKVLPAPKTNIKPSKIKPLKRIKKNFKKIKSQTLTTRTKLTPEQMQQVILECGNGEAMKYNLVDNTYELNLKLLRNLNKAKKKARQEILFSDQLGRRLYVADRAHILSQLTESEIENRAWLTFNKKEALIFYEGFDDINIKKKFYDDKHKLEFQTTHP